MAHRQRNRPKQPTPPPVSTDAAPGREESSEPDEPAIASDITVLSDSLIRESVPISRQRRIEQAAYRLAQQRGFEPGHELQDWLQAEKQIDDELSSSAPPRDGMSL